MVFAFVRAVDVSVKQEDSGTDISVRPSNSGIMQPITNMIFNIYQGKWQLSSNQPVNISY